MIKTISETSKAVSVVDFENENNDEKYPISLYDLLAHLSDSINSTIFSDKSRPSEAIAALLPHQNLTPFVNMAMPHSEKHYTDFTMDFDFDWESDPDTAANLHIWLPPYVFKRMDEVIQSLPSMQSREDFGVVAILWALESVECDVSSTRMELEETSNQPTSSVQSESVLPAR